MKTRLLPGRIDYDGSQIRSLWAYRSHGIQGDSLVAFRGACGIPVDNIVDLEDVRAGSRIASPLMLHFISEHFDLDLEKAVWRQRLLSVLVRDVLSELAPRKRIRREGDDLFLGPGKLSISIATLTPVSSKVHFGINIVRALDVGVETRSLSDLRVDAAPLAVQVLRRYAAECASVLDARTRVRGVP